ncbi:MAG: universal stress protein [Magnetospiraceae bacterium]
MFKKILIAVDLQDPASTKKALEVAVSHAKAFGAVLEVLTVVPEFGYPSVGGYLPEGTEEKIIADAKESLHAVVGADVPKDVKCRYIVAQGSIYHRILEFAEKEAADLIIVTAHRPELKDYLLGPNSARVVRHANCSVLVIRV